MYIDTHAHLSDKKFLDKNEIINLADSLDVKYIISCGTNLISCQEEFNISQKNKNVFCAMGIHPEDITNDSLNDLKKIAELCNNKKVVAVGEVGLDFHYTKENIERQNQILIEQIKMAYELKLPLIFHFRDASDYMLQIITKCEKYLKYGAVFHCFSGSVEIAKQLVKKGFYLGVGGICTFSNAKKLIEVIKEIPLEYLLLETDSPYLAPEPFRSQVNQPAYIPLIAKKIADIKNISVKEVEKITTRNALNLFTKIGDSLENHN